MTGIFAQKEAIQAAMETEQCIVLAKALGLAETDAREEIRAENARARARPRPFDWSEVRKRLNARATA